MILVEEAAVDLHLFAPTPIESGDSAREEERKAAFIAGYCKAANDLVDTSVERAWLDVLASVAPLAYDAWRASMKRDGA